MAHFKQTIALFPAQGKFMKRWKFGILICNTVRNYGVFFLYVE